MAELDDYFKAREIIIPGSVVTPVREQPGDVQRDRQEDRWTEQRPPKILTDLAAWR